MDQLAYFIELAYQYYPKGISFEDFDRYQKTEAYNRLTNKISESEILNPYWNSFLNYAENNLEYKSVGFADGLDRGFRIAIVMQGISRYYIVLNVSKLIPFYCFYTQDRSASVAISKPEFFTFSKFNQHEQTILNTVELEIHKRFRNFKPFPSNIVKAEVLDIEFQENGKLINDKYKTFYNPFTLFNAFFSSYMFY